MLDTYAIEARLGIHVGELLKQDKDKCEIAFTIIDIHGDPKVVSYAYNPKTRCGCVGYDGMEINIDNISHRIVGETLKAVAMGMIINSIPHNYVLYTDYEKQKETASENSNYPYGKIGE